MLGSLPGVTGIPGTPLNRHLSVPAASVPTIPAELTPQDMWSIYDMPSNNMGQGQSIAIMGSGDSSTTVKDLAIFEQEHGLPKVPVQVTDIPKDGDFSTPAATSSGSSTRSRRPASRPTSTRCICTSPST